MNNKNNRSNRPNKNRPPRFGRNSNQQSPNRPESGGGRNRSLPVSTSRHTPQQRPEDLNKKWDRLKDVYLQARKKFYEHYHRSEGVQREKLENDYYDALGQLRKFEQFLYKNHRPLIGRSVTQYRQDLEYSTHHQEDQKELPLDIVPMIEKIDCHITDNQQERTSFQDDREESVGTMDDYYQFKANHPRQSDK